MPSGVRVRLPPWAPYRYLDLTVVVTPTQTVHLISPDDVALETLEVPRTDRLCLVVIRVKNYTNVLSDTEKSYARSVSNVRREQYSSGRRAVQIGLSTLNISEVPILFDERRPSWPASIVGSIAHSQNLALAVVGFRQDFQGVGIDILPQRAVSAKVRDRILLDSEQKFVLEQEHKDWQTILFSAKESIYKASNPFTDEYLGFKDLRVMVETSGTEFKAATTSQKLSTDLIACGRGYVVSVENHWLTLFLIE